jgi:prepilin-type N-terminal cleavage/methylation domain-containing protein
VIPAPATSKPTRNSRLSGCRRGFTLLEVMIASVVLVLGIVTAITTLQRGFQSLDSARNLTSASQVMQSEMERLRLKNWNQIEDLQKAGEAVIATEDERFTCTLAISDLKTDMKEIVLRAEWRGYDGRPQTARLITRYGKSGLNDYFYTTH